MKTRAAPLRGLVLAGGRSLRMGRDKGSLRYHGKDQRSHSRELLARHCPEVYLSCRLEQASSLEPGDVVIFDAKEFSGRSGVGPAGGLLSAHALSPESAWLVLACDMPAVDDDLIRLLLSKRNPSACATAFRDPTFRRPEPLFALWEPKGLDLLARRVECGRFSPRDALESSDRVLIAAPSWGCLMNINTPQERRSFSSGIEDKPPTRHS